MLSNLFNEFPILYVIFLEVDIKPQEDIKHTKEQRQTNRKIEEIFLITLDKGNTLNNKEKDLC